MKINKQYAALSEVFKDEPEKEVESKESTKYSTNLYYPKANEL